jgi:hypothetical protein
MQLRISRNFSANVNANQYQKGAGGGGSHNRRPMNSKSNGARLTLGSGRTDDSSDQQINALADQDDGERDANVVDDFQKWSRAARVGEQLAQPGEQGRGRRTKADFARIKDKAYALIRLR